MDTLDDLAARLVAYGGCGTTAAPNPSIFTGRFPSEPATAIQLRGHLGMGGVRAMGKGTHPVMSPESVQAIIRAEKKADAYDLALRVYDALDGWEGTVNGSTYLWVEARHRPYYLGPDENNRAQYTVNFVAHRGR